MATKSYTEFKPDYAIPPGDTLSDVLESKGMTQQELSIRTGMATKTINEIVKGKAPISADTALKLESVFGVNASFWLNLEMHYQEDMARIKAKKGLFADIEQAKRFPYAEMAQKGWVTPTRKSEDKVNNLRQFFGVASLERLEDMAFAANFRRRHTPKTSFHALSAWLRKAVLNAEEISTDPFSLKSLKESVPLLRELARCSCTEFCDHFERAQEICGKCGVALTIVPHLHHTSVNGATQWISPVKAVISLSLRYPFWDVFWFSFFHELGHIVKGHSKKEIYVNLNDSDDDIREEAANSFAADTLIPPGPFEEFRSRENFSDDAIEAFAEEMETSPVIVLGRLCKERILSWDNFAQPRFGRRLQLT